VISLRKHLKQFLCVSDHIFFHKIQMQPRDFIISRSFLFLRHFTFLDYGSNSAMFMLPLSQHGCQERPVWCGNGRPFNISHLRQRPFYDASQDFDYTHCFIANLLARDGSNKKITLSVNRYWCEITWGKYRVICEIPI
jgi:hypothetical protein